MRSGHHGRLFPYIRRRSAAIAADVDEELSQHIAMTTDALVAQGMSRRDARREALRRFGDLDGTRRYCRHQDEEKESRMQGLLILTDLLEDLRVGARGLLRAPVLSLAIVLTVGLGIGGTAAIFAAVDAVLIRPLPYDDPGRLVRVYTDSPPFRFRFSAADWLALQAQQTSFDDLATYTDRSMTFSEGDSVVLAKGRLVSWSFFRTLGIRPALGHAFTEADGRPGRSAAVILSHGFWQSRLGARPERIGKPIRLDGADYLVSGVLPERVGPLEQGQDVFIVQSFFTPPRRGPFLYTVVARLRRDVAPSVAGQELHAINRRIFPLWKASYQDEKATWNMVDLKSQVVGDTGTTAGLALAAVALVWLIACANASNLLLARVTGRRAELAMRTALGASRGRIARFLLAESALLAAASLSVGAVLARGGIGVLQRVGPAYFPRMHEVGFSGPVVWLLCGLGVSSALMFGLIPALHGRGAREDGTLRSSQRTATATRGARRVRDILVGAQFAIVTPLLVVAALLLVTLNALRSVDIGFDGRSVLTGSIRLPPALYRDEDRVRGTWQEIESRVASLPGVTGVAFADGLPPDRVGNFNNFDLEEFPAPPGKAQPVTPWVAVTPGYFGTLGLNLLEGRLLDERDAQQDDLLSVVVDRAWAQRFFPGRSAVGKRFREGGCTTCPWTTVVGVVSEVKYDGLDKPDRGSVYWPLGGSTSRYLVVRTRQAAPAQLVPVLERTVRELAPGAALTATATIDDLASSSLERPQSLSLLLAAFAAVAGALSVIGIYAALNYYVQQHLREMSIRLALGGRRGHVVRLIVVQGMTVVAAGVAAGLALAYWTTGLMASLLFEVRATDPVVFAMTAGVLLLVAFSACLLPAIRAAAAEPATLLRQE
jgi:putative ABC transport system permease protein